MRKPASSVAVTERPDARHVGAQLVVHNDVPALILNHTRLFKAKVVRVGAASHRQKEVRPIDLGGAIGAVHANSYSIVPFRNADTFCMEADVNAFGLEDVVDSEGNVFILTVNEARLHFDDGDRAAKTPEHLSEFQADVTAADDHKMRRQEIDLQHRGVCQKINLIEPWHIGHDGPASHIDEDAVRREQVFPNSHLVSRQESGMPFKDRAILHALEPFFNARSGPTGYVVFPGLHSLHVDGDGSGIHAILSGTP